MPENQKDLAAERDRLQQENEQLRGQLAAAGAHQPYKPQPFMLTEGARLELETQGVTTIGGRTYTREQALEAAEKAGQHGIEIAETTVDVPAPRPQREAVPGVDFVWPSVAPGQIDPAVAGTPGINGPAADAKHAPAKSTGASSSSSSSTPKS